MKTLINFFLNVLMIVLTIDAIGFVLWSISGQTPIDGFFIGAITKNIISLITSLF